MKKFFEQKGKALYLLYFIKAMFPSALRRRKSYRDGKQVKNPQKYFNI